MALVLRVPDRHVWVRMWIPAAALSVSCIGCGVACLPHNYLWILASRLASASAFSSEIKASLGVLGCTQPSLISGSPVLVWRCVLLGAEGPGFPLGSRMWFPRLCGLILSALSCFWLLSATTFSHPWMWQGGWYCCDKSRQHSPCLQAGKSGCPDQPGLKALGSPGCWKTLVPSQSVYVWGDVCRSVVHPSPEAVLWGV